MWLKLFKVVSWPPWKACKPREWLASNFSLHHHPWNKHWGDKNIGNDHEPKQLFIVNPIFLVSTLGNIKKNSMEIIQTGLGLSQVAHMASKLIPISKAQKDKEFWYFSLDGMLFDRWLPLSIFFRFLNVGCYPVIFLSEERYCVAKLSCQDHNMMMSLALRPLDTDSGVPMVRPWHFQ